MGWYPSCKEMGRIVGVTAEAVGQRINAICKKGYIAKDGVRKYKILK